MMTLSQWQTFLLWGAGINYALLIVFFLAWAWFGDAIHRLHSRWFDIDRRTCHAIAYLLMGLYKLAIWMGLLVPWFVLWLLQRQAGAP
jgi:hypothetical protein